MRAVRIFVLTIILAAFGFTKVQASEVQLTADEVIAKAVKRAQDARAKATTDFTYTKITLTEELDAAGKVKERKQRVYQVYFRDGMTRLKLIEVDGHAPDPSDLKKQNENEVNAQKLLGDSRPAGSVNRDNFLTQDLVARYDFTLLGEKVINGRRAYKISFQPKSPALPVHHLVDRLLNRIAGTLWIDADEFEMARAEVYLGSEVNFLGGIAGSLKKLAYTMTRTRVADGVWLSTSSAGDFEGRKLLDSTRIKTRSESRNFRSVRLAS
jgi:hypothetical protein